MANNRLHGKTIVALGDSLFHGNLDCQGNTWLEMVAKRNGMTLHNYGQNGNTVAVQHTEAQVLAPMCVRYADMADVADYVVVLAVPTISGFTFPWAISLPTLRKPSAAR